MLYVLRLVFALIAAPAVLLALVVFKAVDNFPNVQMQWRINHNDIANAKHIFDGTTLRDNIKTVELSQRDLNIALHHLLNNYLPSSSSVKLDNNKLHFDISLKLPENLFGPYLNLKFDVSKQEQKAVVSGLQVGKVQIDDQFASVVVEKFIKYAHLKQHYILVTEQILNFELEADKVHLTYVTDPEFLDNNIDLLANADDQKALMFYRNKLTEIINKHDPNWLLSIADLLRPLFAIAYQRSNLDTAIHENRLVIFTVNSYINRREILPYLPKNVTAKPNRDFAVFMYRRIDMAQHFIGSAALTTTGGAHLANIMGMEKELSDARGGSGFSFVDLAGDRAGMRFGQFATSTPENARKLQKRMAKIKNYTEFMPEVRDLPENMDRKTFKAKFGSVYSPKYQQVLQEIDDRITNLALYQ